MCNMKMWGISSKVLSAMHIRELFGKNQDMKIRGKKKNRKPLDRNCSGGRKRSRRRNLPEKLLRLD